jgi:mercuric reductase
VASPLRFELAGALVSGLGVYGFTGTPIYVAIAVAPTLDGGAWVGAAGTTGADVAAEALLLATGHRAAVRGLDLSAAGVRLTPSGWIAVDDTLATTGEGVLAAGRVTGLLPHGATDPVMARVAGGNAVATGRRPRGRWSADGAPRLVRTEPAVASVGLDPLAAGQVPDVRISALPLRSTDQALLAGRSVGLVTLVAGARRPAPAPRLPLPRRPEPASTLLGAGIIGPHAGELAGLVAMAIRSGLTVDQLADAPLSSRSWAAALQHAAAGFEA